MMNCYLRRFNPFPALSVFEPKPYRLTCYPQHYAWGKPAVSSLVAELCNQSDGNQPYAELWIGAHPKAPSTVRVEEKDQQLDDLVRSNTVSILGSTTAKRWGAIPFLFKVLSVARPLSIQLHPSKEEARKLHALNPKEYPDENHKPEIAIAVTPIELLYGVRPLAELSVTLNKYPAIGSLVPRSKRSSSRDIFETVLSAETSARAAAAREVAMQIGHRSKRAADEIWFLKALELFGAEDRGVWCFFLMHLSTIPTGQALFTGTQVPHAYLSGDIIECMANSDNVVRAGLTEKFQDLPALFKLIDYSVSAPTLLTGRIVGEQPGRERFCPAAQEFSVEKLSHAGIFEVTLDSVAILLCIAGNAVLKAPTGQMEISKGSVILLPAGMQRCEVQNLDGELYLASVPA